MNKRCMGCMNEYSDEFEICPYCGFVENSEPESPLHMEPGTYLADRYIVGRVVGYGGFGVTYIGWDAKLEQKVAIKEYLPSEFSTRAPGHSKLTVYSGDKAEQFSKGLNQFVDEAKRLAKFQNTTGIVKVFDSFEEKCFLSLLKRFTPQLVLLTVICLIATFGYIKTEILEVGSSPDTIPSVILDAGHGGLTNYTLGPNVAVKFNFKIHENPHKQRVFAILHNLKIKGKTNLQF